MFFDVLVVVVSVCVLAYGAGVFVSGVLCWMAVVVAVWEFCFVIFVCGLGGFLVVFFWGYGVLMYVVVVVFFVFFGECGVVVIWVVGWWFFCFFLGFLSGGFWCCVFFSLFFVFCVFVSFFLCSVLFFGGLYLLCF